MFRTYYTVVSFLLFVCTARAEVTSNKVSFAYPDGDPTFNYLDEVIVDYNTQWPAGVNLSVYCQETASTPEWPSFYQTYDNPLVQAGPYTIEAIGNPDDLKDILQFPTLCWFKIQNNAVSHESAVGGNFTMASTVGPKKTWGLGIATSGAAAATTTSISAATHGSPLSTGAKTGIGVGAAIGGLLVLALAMWAVILHRKLRRTEHSLAKLSAIQKEQAHAAETPSEMESFSMYGAAEVGAASRAVNQPAMFWSAANQRSSTTPSV